MEKTRPIRRLGQRLPEDYPKRSDSSGGLAGSRRQHGRRRDSRLPPRQRPSADKGESRLLGGLDGVWHPSPCQVTGQDNSHSEDNGTT